MKKKFLHLRSFFCCGVLLFISAQAVQAQTLIYLVDASSSNSFPFVSTTVTSTSWNNACNNLQSAINIAAITGGEIWVKKGIYRPSSFPSGCVNCGSDTRNYSFDLRNNVRIYGGFAGTETLLSQRNRDANPTILSGDIGITGTAGDNCYHVVTSVNNSSTTALESVFIQDGIAGGDGSININNTYSIELIKGSGGGIFTCASSARFADCMITKNSGGGVMITPTNFNARPKNASAPVFDACTFTLNNGSYGGAVSAIGSFDYRNLPQYTNCKFISNTAVCGAGVYSYWSNSTYTNCYFEKNTVTGYGGAVLIRLCNNTFNGCEFRSNTAYSGGALFLEEQTTSYGDGATCSVANSKFLNNVSTNTSDVQGHGGAICTEQNTSIYISNSAMDGNSAYTGGAIQNAGTIYLRNISFSRNTATKEGAAIQDGSFNSLNPVPSSILNCTFWDNSGPYDCGYSGFTPEPTTLTNCVIWNPTSNLPGIVNNSSKASPAVTYSLIKGGYNGTGNTYAAPLFVNGSNPAGADNIFLTADDGLRQQTGSPTINTGNNAVVSNGATDILGNNRIQVFTVDMGAYEGSFCVPSIALTTSTGSYSICAGTPVIFTATPVNAGNAPTYQWRKNGNVVATTNINTFVTNALAMDDAINVVITSNASCRSDATATSNTVVMTVYPIVTPSVTITASSTNICAGTPVTFTATPVNGSYYFFLQWFKNGIPIANATLSTYTISTLANNDVISVKLTSQNPCATTSTVTSNTITVKVLGNAAGVLYVDKGIASPGNGSTWATAFNELKDALNLAGQCSNISAIYVARGIYKPTYNENRDSAFVIPRSGLKIYGGYPNGGGERNISGNPTTLSGEIGSTYNNSDNSYHVVVIAGITNSADSLVLDGFTITGGYASAGGSKIINGQTVYQNYGGGICLQNNNNAGGKIAIRNCNIRINNALFYGGGLYNQLSSPTIANCVFQYNSSYIGNGQYADAGGALFNYNYSSPKVINCVFVSNSAGRGAAVHNYYYASPQIINCSMATNNASGGGAGIFNEASSTAVITNCIIWGNTGINSGINNITNGAATVTYSIVQGGYPGTGNLNQDPLFVNTSSGDLRLQPYSPGINSGTNTATDLPATDLLNQPRIMNGTVDRGAYEYQAIINSSRVVTTGDVKSESTSQSLLATKGISALNSITLYPVPAKDFVWLNGICTGLLGTNAVLVDVQGRIMQSIRLNQLPQRIDVSALVPGTYLLKVNGEKALPFIKQ